MEQEVFNKLMDNYKDQKKSDKKDRKEFSKVLLIQESILIWILTITFIILAFYCVKLGFLGSLPWLGAMVALPWTAYGVSQACYYNKSKAENTEGGIKYASVITNSTQTTTIPLSTCAADDIPPETAVNIDTVI